MNNPSIFSYPHKPIASLEKLAICLGISVSELIVLQQNSNEYFFLCKRKQKDDGSFRDTYDVKQPLKEIHGKIVNRFLRNLNYPEYLQGGIKKRDCISNAKQHVKSNVIISEDITNFFPSISKKIIYQVWTGFFHFSHEVAECLSELITFNGFLVQGCKASGYLCNLILWDREYQLFQKLQKKGLTYTRYVDDVNISSPYYLNNKEKAEIVGNIVSLFQSVGARSNRKKHKIMHKGSVQTINKMNVTSKRPTISKKERSNIRAAVYECEVKFQKEKNSDEYKKLFSSTQGRVQYMERLHSKEADKLLRRLKLVQP